MGATELCGLWRRLITWVKKLWATEDPRKKEEKQLAQLVEIARREWVAAQEYYKCTADRELIDYAIYTILAAERKYIFLLRRAHKEGLVSPSYFEKS
jgi:hypothetical protein